LRISSTWPLGLFYAWSIIDPALEIIVWPVPAGSRELPRGSASRGMEKSGEGSGSEDFRGLRDYQPGDPTSHIHWKAMARIDKPVIKTFGGLSSEDLVLHWNDTLQLPNYEARLSQLCRWVLSADEAAATYVLTLPGMHVPPGNGPAHRRRCLNALAKWAP